MSIQAMAWVLDHKLNIKPAQKLVLLCLANYAGEDGEDAFPSVVTIARHTEMSERSVQRIIQDLLALGLISHGNQRIPEAKGYPTNYMPNCYNIKISSEADGLTVENVRNSRGDKSGKTGVTKTTSRGDKNSVRGDKSGKTGVTPLSPKPLYKPSIEPTTNPRAENQASDEGATEGWIEFGHEVIAAAGIDPQRSMAQTGCVRQWLADAAKAGYTRQQAEAVILQVVRERAKYGGHMKPPSWFSRPVQEALSNGAVFSSQKPAECSLPSWEGDCRRDYLTHVRSLSNGAGKIMPREAFTAQWLQMKGIEA